MLLIVLNSSYGGAEKHVYDLVSHFDYEKVNVSVVVPSEAKLVSLLKPYIKPEDIMTINRGVMAIRHIKKIIDHKQPDIIHLHSPRATFIGIIAQFLSRHKSRIVVTAHGWIPDRLRMRKLYELLYIHAIKRCDHIIAVSHHVKGLLEDHSVKGDMISVIHNGIPITKGIQVGLPQERKHFVFLGRLIEEKGVSYLLQTIDLLDSTISWAIL